MRRRVVAACGIALLATASAPRLASAHPLHSTMSELTEDRAHGVVRAMIRVFADDFGTAAERATRTRLPASLGASWDVAALNYVSTTFGFSDRSGRALPLRSCGTKRTADLLWICVEANSTDGLGALKVRNVMLSDLFDDQVNVVQASVGGARRSLLFTRGDRPKAIAA